MDYGVGLPPSCWRSYGASASGAGDAMQNLSQTALLWAQASTEAQATGLRRGTTKHAVERVVIAAAGHRAPSFARRTGTIRPEPYRKFPDRAETRFHTDRQ